MTVLGFYRWYLHSGSLSGWHVPVAEAVCLNPITGQVPHPRDRCPYEGCGIYVAKSVDSIRGRWEPHDHALGVVALTGKVIEEEHGFRGEFGVAVAMSAAAVRRWWVGDWPSLVRHLFLRPVGLLSNWGVPMLPSQIDPETYLEEWRERHSNPEELSRRIVKAHSLNPHTQRLCSDSKYDESLAK
jgi:hypothetical protein